MDLYIDRTNWKFGKKDINFLVLAAKIKGITIPIFWELLDHKGNSDYESRLRLMEKFKTTFGVSRIRSFMADREFIGKEWFDYLLQHKIRFYIRIKDNRYLEWVKDHLKGGAGEKGKRISREFFQHLKGPEESRVIYNALHDQRINVAGTRLKSGELLLVCSNDSNMKRILQTYKDRWQIEMLFKNMKTQGMNLEKTHMKCLKRLHALMVLVAMALTLCCLVGVSVNCVYKRTVKTPLYSYFTRGFRRLKKFRGVCDIWDYILMFFKSEG